MAAVVAVARSGVEQGIAAEQRGLPLASGEHTDVRHGMPRGVETFELHRPPDAHDIALAEPAVDAADAACRGGMRQDPGSGRADQTRVAARMIAMLVSVEDLGDLPA